MGFQETYYWINGQQLVTQRFVSLNPLVRWRVKRKSRLPTLNRVRALEARLLETND